MLSAHLFHNLNESTSASRQGAGYGCKDKASRSKPAWREWERRQTVALHLGEMLGQLCSVEIQASRNQRASRRWELLSRSRALVSAVEVVLCRVGHARHLTRAGTGGGRSQATGCIDPLDVGS